MNSSASRAAASCVVLALLVSACASEPAPPPPGSAHAAASAQQTAPGRSNTMVSGEESGLGLSGAETPPALKAIAAAPYALAAPLDCAAMGREVADLDELLGPDVDILADPKARAGLDHQASQAFGSALRGFIPYRWVFRWMTQAGRADQELRQAILAGTARRGFLKGLRQGMGCPPPPLPPPLPRPPTN